MKLIMDSHDTPSDDSIMSYDGIGHATTHDISRYLQTNDVDAVLLRNTVSPIYLNTPTHVLNPHTMDTEFMKRVGNKSPHLDKLFRAVQSRAINPDTPMLSHGAQTEHQLSYMKLHADKLVITKQQIILTRSLYGISRSPIVIKRVTKHDHCLYGERLQYQGVSNLISACVSLGIPVDVERDGLAYSVTTMQEVEDVAATFALHADGADIITDARTIGNGYITRKEDVTHITESLSKTLRHEKFSDALYVFFTRDMARYQMRQKKDNKQIKFCDEQVTWYGGDKLPSHKYSSVVLVGVPKLNPNTAFITDPDPAMAVHRYKRFHLLQAIGTARNVCCIGISEKYIYDALSGIPGIICYDKGGII